MTFDQFYNDARASLELPAFLANIGLVFVAWKALEQLTIAKRDIHIRVEREAAMASANQLEIWAEKIVPAVMQVVGAHDKVEFERMRGSMERFDVEELAQSAGSVQKYQADMVKLFQDHPEIDELSIRACNLVEASAMCFMTGVAKEEIVFTSLSRIFCEFVEWMRPVYCGMRKQGQPNQWEHTIRLHRVWSQRRNEHELENQKDALHYALNKAKNEGTPIPPLGAR